MIRENDNGFTLLEVLIAIVILSIGLLGMASLTVGIIKGNKFSNDVTMATTLAEDKMEEIRNGGYDGLPSSNTITSEAYGSITGYSQYKRVTDTSVATGMKTVAVRVYWDSDGHHVELKTIVVE